MTKELILFSGLRCCLCDDAEQLIKQSAPSWYTQLHKIDVTSTPEIYHLYGARIPVLKRSDNGRELGWPFDQNQLTEFLS
jgi:hypothetical protein